MQHIQNNIINHPSWIPHNENTNCTPCQTPQ